MACTSDVGISRPCFQHSIYRELWCHDRAGRPCSVKRNKTNPHLELKGFYQPIQEHNLPSFSDVSHLASSARHAHHDFSKTSISLALQHWQHGNITGLNAQFVVRLVLCNYTRVDEFPQHCVAAYAVFCALAARWVDWSSGAVSVL